MLQLGWFIFATIQNMERSNKHSLYTILTRSEWQLTTVLNTTIFWLPSSNETTHWNVAKTKYNKNSLTVHNINNISEETITGARIRPYEKKKLCCIIHKKYKTLRGTSTHFYAHLLSLNIQNVDNFFRFNVHISGHEHILPCP